jgi:N-acetylglucosaminyl-diphospho-decaprenol L-rhamnosyltransferase
MTATLAAVVIHHRRFPDVLDTVHGLVEAGVAPECLLVVDNSEDAEIEAALRAAADEWRVLTVPNRGYGAAANAGAAMMAGSDFLLVATHEVRIDGPSLRALVAGLAADPDVAAVGPGLICTDGGRVWSRGGLLTPRLRLPRQIIDDVVDSPMVRDVDWLDGACVLYRAGVLVEHPFREDFFMYFEETELHTRLRALGWRIATVEDATAYQSSNGMPAYWGCRNVVLFQRAHGTWMSRLLAPPYFTLRAMAIEALSGRWHAVLDAPRGLLAGCGHSRGGTL